MLRADNLHVLIVLKSGILNLLEPPGPVQACNGIALPLPYLYLIFSNSNIRSILLLIVSTPTLKSNNYLSCLQTLMQSLSHYEYIKFISKSKIPSCIGSKFAILNFKIVKQKRISLFLSELQFLPMLHHLSPKL